MAAEERIWMVHADETGEVNPAELADAQMEVAGILRRIGGAVRQQARRRQISEDPPLYITERVDFMWTLHAPLPKRRRQEPPPEVEDFVDEVEAEPEEPVSTAAVAG